MRIRCKFFCQEVTESFTTEHNKETGKPEPKSIFTSKFAAVGSDNSEENKQFFKWTPSGELKLGTHNEAAFEPGKEYYIDITPAEGT